MDSKALRKSVLLRILRLVLIAFAILLALSSIYFKWKTGFDQWYFGFGEGGVFVIDHHDNYSLNLSEPLTLTPPIFWYLPRYVVSHNRYAYPTVFYLPFWIPIALIVFYRSLRLWRAHPSSNAASPAES
jgi:hypothetical protein